MNKQYNQELISNISDFYILFQKEILDLLPDSNSSTLSELLFKALHEIYFNKNITPSKLSKRLSISIPNTSRCLNKLIKSGYIIKTKNQIDKRIVHIELSEKGLKLVENSLETTNKKLLDKIEVLDCDEIIQLSESFLKLKSLIEKIRTLNSTK